MATLKFVRSVWKSFRDNSGLEPRLLDNLHVSAARPGLVRFSLAIESQHLNRLGILHGGTLASLTDLGGSLAVASKGLFATGVSTDLNVTYLAAGGKLGERLTGEVRCDKFGRNLAYTSVTFWNAAGEVAARGSHTKFVKAAWADPRNKTDEAQGPWLDDKGTEEEEEVDAAEKRDRKG